MVDSSDSDFEELASALKSFGSEDERDEDKEIDLEAKSESENEIQNNSPIKPRKRRRKEDPEDEKELNKFLFGDKIGLIENLEGKKFFLDVSPDDDENAETSKQVLWHDSDDEDFVEKKGEYAEIKQKRKFERITGSNPKWAELNRKKEDSESDDEAITKSVGFIDKKAKTGKGIPKNTINYKRLRDINQETRNEGRIVSIEFHPKSTVGIVAGMRGMVSIFAIDGKENKKIHNILYDKFYIYSCKLVNEGEELIVGGGLRDFHIYNLISGHKQRTKLPRGVMNLKNFEVSQCGKYMAVVGDYGEVHLLHAATKELLTTMKQEYQSTSLSFSQDSNFLYSHSDDNEVTIFDLRTQRVKHKFSDEGCVNGTVLTVSSNGQFLATGSRQGFVNIYNCEDVLASKYPKPASVFSNLTTEISDLKFNHTSELLAMCSVDSKNALKLAHVQSGSVFSNFPTHLDHIGQPTVLEFSPESGYLGVGTLDFKVPLYRLRHFNNY